MDDLIDQIQQDILNNTVPLAEILLKVKVLAFKLRNDELKNWVKNELDGYGNNDVPDYRVLHSQPRGYLTNGHRAYTNHPVEMQILDDEMREEFSTSHVKDGVRTIEEMAKSDALTYPWPAGLVSAFNQLRAEHADDYYNYVNIGLPVPGFMFAQILSTIRSRLQDLVLEISNLPWRMNSSSPPPTDEVQRIFNVTINNNSQGGSVSTFDQRGQQVNYQYNAARDINFGTVQNIVELVTELQKLKAEIRKAGDARIIEGEVVDKAEYQVSQAITAAKQPVPDKKKLSDLLGEAKMVILTAGATAAAVPGLVEGIQHAIDAVQKVIASS